MLHRNQQHMLAVPSILVLWNLMAFLPATSCLPTEAFLLQLFLGDLEAAAHRSTWSTVAGDTTLERSEVAMGFMVAHWGDMPHEGPIYKAIF